MSSVYRETISKAMYSHRCMECSGTIEKGEQYTYLFSAESGCHAVNKRCATCQSLYKQVAQLEIQAGYDYEDRTGWHMLEETLMCSKMKGLEPLREQYLANKLHRGGGVPYERNNDIWD